jgi:hypothetical protein
MKAQHQQVEVDRSQTLTEFITDDEIKLKRGVHYYLHSSPMFILLSFVLLVVLINCMDLSPRRVTTALSVHGTTVIHKGSLEIIKL